MHPWAAGEQAFSWASLRAGCQKRKQPVHSYQLLLVGCGQEKLGHSLQRPVKRREDILVTSG